MQPLWTAVWTFWSSNPTLGHISRENHNSKRSMYVDVHCSTAGNSQDVQATEMSINKWIKKSWCMCVYIHTTVPYMYMASLVAQMVKNLPAMWETWIWPLGRKDPLEKRMATHSSILAWRFPWTIPWGCKESDTTEWLSHTRTHTHPPFKMSLSVSLSGVYWNNTCRHLYWENSSC